MCRAKKTGNRRGTYPGQKMAVMSRSENGIETPSMPFASRPLPLELVELVDACLAGVGGEGKYDGERVGPPDELDVPREARSSDMTASIGTLLDEPLALGRFGGGAIDTGADCGGTVCHAGAQKGSWCRPFAEPDGCWGLLGVPLCRLISV